MVDEIYNEIEHLIKKKEINTKIRYLKDNAETINTYWNIGRLIVEAQGGEARAQYGNKLIKEWSSKLTQLYGKGYTPTNLKYFRTVYLLFPKSHTLCDPSWSHV